MKVESARRLTNAITVSNDPVKVIFSSDHRSDSSKMNRRHLSKFKFFLLFNLRIRNEFSPPLIIVRDNERIDLSFVRLISRSNDRHSSPVQRNELKGTRVTRYGRGASAN